ncbi:MAG: Rrf2 family transcriptional regulator, partial [Oscillospiraceae bacterium]
MHITLEADYAIRIVHCLAKSKKRLDAKTIAEQTTVTLRFALKILRKLVASGIVKS